jgi:hypothetical protein
MGEQAGGALRKALWKITSSSARILAPVRAKHFLDGGLRLRLTCRQMTTKEGRGHSRQGMTASRRNE